MIKQAYRQQVQIGETDLTELSIHEMRAEEATIRDELQFVKIQHFLTNDSPVLGSVAHKLCSPVLGTVPTAKSSQTHKSQVKVRPKQEAQPLSSGK